jgi:hypothetical protein
MSVSAISEAVPARDAITDLLLGTGLPSVQDLSANLESLSSRDLDDLGDDVLVFPCYEEAHDRGSLLREPRASGSGQRSGAMPWNSQNPACARLMHVSGAWPLTASRERLAEPAVRRSTPVTTRSIPKQARK